MEDTKEVVGEVFKSCLLSVKLMLRFGFLSRYNSCSRANGSYKCKFLSMAKFPLTSTGPGFSCSAKFVNFN